jgi:phage-related protein (TIGR01555 family)
MISKWFNRKPEIKKLKKKKQIDLYEGIDEVLPRRMLMEATAKTFQVDLPEVATMDGTMDAGVSGVKFNFQWGSVVPDALVSWYASQGFIGYQMAATLAQHWLISKACLMPAEDAIRNGYKVTVNDGTEVSTEILDAIRQADKECNLNTDLLQFIQMGRVFGIRIAFFQVDSSDPDYYFKPFNPDGILPNSYRGISQIDPYWITPELDAEAAGDPSSEHFYEPTWWRVNGNRIHRTHLIIYRTEEVADILKPTYVYGGVPIPQKIYERVYNAERTANEAPLLAMSKRTDVIKIDTSQGIAKEGRLKGLLEKFAITRNNFGTRVIGKDDDAIQFDTSLADLDVVIMSQFQLVAAAANVPAVKLLGTSPKGFNTTGEYEEANYHEMLESLQTHGLTPLIERHHLLLIRSKIAPEFGIEPFSTEVQWNALDAMTAKEQAELNKLNADTGQVLQLSGAIDGNDERQRIINDPQSGYSGLIDEDVLNDDEEILSDPDGA